MKLIFCNYVKGGYSLTHDGRKQQNHFAIAFFFFFLCKAWYFFWIVSRQSTHMKYPVLFVCFFLFFFKLKYENVKCCYLIIGGTVFCRN